MTGFKFRLEKVLEMRLRKEQEKEKELADLKMLQAREEVFLEQLKEEGKKTKESISEIQDKTESSLDLKELISYYEYLENIGERISVQIEQIKLVIESIEKKRGELIEASKERKVIEKLKDNQFKKFKQELEQTERKFLDEIGTINHNRKRVLWKM